MNGSSSGCSPVEMKKQISTFLGSNAESRETIIFSAGQIGYQVELEPGNLSKAVAYQAVELTVTGGSDS